MRSPQCLGSIVKVPMHLAALVGKRCGTWFCALDPISTSLIEELMVELTRERAVVVTHNMQQATRGRTVSRLDFPLCDN